MKLLIVSDVHGNADALDRIIMKEKQWDLFVFAGDAVGRGPEPNEVIETLRDVENFVGVLGNWDYAVITGKVDMARKEEDKENVEWTRSVLREENMYWLQMLPMVKELDIDSKKMTIVHGSPDVILYGYVYPWTDKSALRTYLRETELLVVGHTHIPFVFEWKTKTWGHRILINPGSPAYPKSGAKPSYAVLDTECWRVKIKTV
ncbi:MAG: metallophosphoesterase family protein [Candidatus Diapherotrites archaeon]|nr:metallophosphoesterase family protein [Candidatus Diapherotrites archaeon]